MIVIIGVARNCFLSFKITNIINDVDNDDYSSNGHSGENSCNCPISGIFWSRSSSRAMSHLPSKINLYYLYNIVCYASHKKVNIESDLVDIKTWLDRAYNNYSRHSISLSLSRKCPYQNIEATTMLLSRWF